MALNQINPIGPVREPDAGGRLQPSVPLSKETQSFSETLKTFMEDVNTLQKKADESIKKMAAGEINDVHQVMSSVEEANVAFNMMMEIRGKVMEAYQQVMQIRL